MRNAANFARLQAAALEIVKRTTPPGSDHALAVAENDIQASPLRWRVQDMTFTIAARTVCSSGLAGSRSWSDKIR